VPRYRRRYRFSDPGEEMQIAMGHDFT